MNPIALTFLVSCSLCLTACGQAMSEDSPSITSDTAELAVAGDAGAGNLSVNSGENKELLIPVAEPSQDKMAGQIPENFHGEFRSSESACGSDADDSVLVVTSDQLSFWETVATPETIVQKSPNELLVNLLNEGEGETWNTEIAMLLSQNGNVLSIREGDFSFDRVRCPDE